jgi:hypothetical protein
VSDHIEEIRVNPDGDVLVVKFENIPDRFRVTAREGKVIGGPADPVSPDGWPAVFFGSAVRSYTFTPTAEPQLVFFEGDSMSHVDHGDEGPQAHMSDRALYMLDALLRLASRRVTGEIMKREGKE